ncbi:unnamed protein product [Chrysoparadoxa australica]
MAAGPVEKSTPAAKHAKALGGAVAGSAAADPWQKRYHLKALKWRVEDLPGCHYRYIPPVSLRSRDPKVMKVYTSLMTLERDLPGIFKDVTTPSGKGSAKRVMSGKDNSAQAKRRNSAPAARSEPSANIAARKRALLTKLRWKIKESPGRHYAFMPPDDARSKHPHLAASYSSLAKVEEDIPGIFDPIYEAGKIGGSVAVSDPEATDTESDSDGRSVTLTYEAESGSETSEAESDAPYDSAADEQASRIIFPPCSNQQEVIDVGGSCDEDDHSDMDSDEDGRGKQQQRQQVQRKRKRQDELGKNDNAGISKALSQPTAAKAALLGERARKIGTAPTKMMEQQNSKQMETSDSRLLKKMWESEKEANELVEMSHSGLLKRIRENEKEAELMSQSHSRLLKKMEVNEEKVEELVERSHSRMLKKIKESEARAEEMIQSQVAMVDIMIQTDARARQLMDSITGMQQIIAESDAKVEQIMLKNTCLVERAERAEVRAAEAEARADAAEARAVAREAELLLGGETSCASCEIPAAC